MGVSSHHPEYDAMADTWRKCRDCAVGQKAVHAAGTRYLPRLKEQTDEDYKAYRDRATFYGAFYRTTVGLKGMLFRTDPQVELPATVQPMTEDVTLSGVPLETFGQMVADEVLTVGRAGVMVDYPRSPDGATQADAMRMNLRPKLALYKTESIINWRTGLVNNANTLIMVVLKETEDIPVDEFTNETDEKKTARYRVLDLTPAGYRQRVFKVGEKGEDVQVDGDVYPQMGNKPMDFIPFQFFGVDDTTPTVFDPPLIDLADMNLSHYRSTADLENGAHFTGLPTAVVSGYTAEEGQKLYIGSQAAWVFPQPEARASYLEFTGQGLDSLFKLIDKKEHQMAILGARMLEQQKRQAETAEAQNIRQQGESSVLAALAWTFSQAMSRALGWFSQWAGASGEVSYQVNTDFSATGMTSQMLTALVGSWQAGAMSQETLFDNLKAGKLYGPEATWEDEETKIREANPVFSGGME